MGNRTGTDGQKARPTHRPKNEVCFVCNGEGYVETEIPDGDSGVVYGSEACRMCGRSGLIYPSELYECQGHGCGVLVEGATLIILRTFKIKCRCGAPAFRFESADPGDLNFPTTSDDYAEAVWSIHDLITLPKGPSNE